MKKILITVTGVFLGVIGLSTRTEASSDPSDLSEATPSRPVVCGGQEGMGGSATSDDSTSVSSLPSDEGSTGGGAGAALIPELGEHALHFTGAQEGIIMEAASAIGKGQFDKMNVHAFNTTILSHLVGPLRSCIGQLGLPPTPGNLEEIREFSEAFYAADPEPEVSQIKIVMGSINAGSLSGELGIKAYDALWQAYALAQRCEQGDGTFMSVFFKLIAENRGEGGGCVDGIVGRAIEAQIRLLVALWEQSGRREVESAL